MFDYHDLAEFYGPGLDNGLGRRRRRRGGPPPVSAEQQARAQQLVDSLVAAGEKVLDDVGNAILAVQNAGADTSDLDVAKSDLEEKVGAVREAATPPQGGSVDQNTALAVRNAVRVVQMAKGRLMNLAKKALADRQRQVQVEQAEQSRAAFAQRQQEAQQQSEAARTAAIAASQPLSPPNQPYSYTPPPQPQYAPAPQYAPPQQQYYQPTPQWAPAPSSQEMDEAAMIAESTDAGSVLLGREDDDGRGGLGRRHRRRRRRAPPPEVILEEVAPAVVATPYQALSPDVNELSPAVGYLGMLADVDERTQRRGSTVRRLGRTLRTAGESALERALSPGGGDLGPPPPDTGAGMPMWGWALLALGLVGGGYALTRKK